MNDIRRIMYDFAAFNTVPLWILLDSRCRSCNAERSTGERHWHWHCLAACCLPVSHRGGISEKRRHVDTSSMASRPRHVRAGQSRRARQGGLTNRRSSSTVVFLGGRYLCQEGSRGGLDVFLGVFGISYVEYLICTG